MHLTRLLCRSVHEEQGVVLMVDKVSFEFLKGATVEFAEDLISASFQVRPCSAAFVCPVLLRVLARQCVALQRRARRDAGSLAPL